MPLLADRVRETSTTTGTGTLTLAGAVTGYQSFSTAFAPGATVYYVIQYGAEWEIGIGTVGAGTLARTQVLQSSNADALVDFSAGTKDVFCSYVADRAVTTSDAATLTNKTISGSDNTLSNIPNSATTATAVNTPSTLVLRDPSGNFAAGTITAGALTASGQVTFGSLKGTGATTVTDILNDGTMATASATTLATSASVKTYVDTRVATVDTLAEVLANGNTTGATDLVVSSGQKIRTPLVAAQDGTSAITLANSTGALTLNTALADTNLATISTAGKVSNSATTATANNTASTIVARDASGNFTAGTITANLTGNISGTAPAGSLTGTTLASNVVTSSLTSVGTLSSLTVSGNLTVDTSTLVVDSANNRVGFGTATPSNVLDVQGAGTGFVGNARFNNFSGNPASAGMYVAAALNGTTQTNWLVGAQYNVNNGFEITPSTAAGGTTFSTPAVTVLSSGNLGVGLTAPSARVHASAADGAYLFGGSGTTRGFRVETTTTETRVSGVDNTLTGSYQPLALAGSSLGFRTNGTQLRWEMLSTGHLIASVDNSYDIGASGASRPRNLYVGTDVAVGTNTLVTSSGSVGMGTTTPTSWTGAKLVLQTLTSTASQFAIDNASFATGQTMGIDFTVASGSKQAFVRAIVENGSTAATALTLGTASGGNTATEQVRVTSVGNVGIGTSSPQALAEFSRATTDATVLQEVVRISTTGRSSTGSPIANRGTLLSFSDSANQTLVGAVGGLRVNAGGNWGGSLAFYVNGIAAPSTGVSTLTEAMRLDSSGNLGVGVTPSAWDGIIRAVELTSGGNALFASTTAIEIGANNIYTSSGFVYKLTGAASRYQQTAGQHRWYNAPSGTAGNAISFTQAMTLDASGNLGIGTTVPAQKLHVVSASGGTSVRIANTNSGNFVDFYETNTSTRQGYFGTPDGTNWNIHNDKNGYIAFDTNNLERWRINASGHLLAGTDNSFDIGASGATRPRNVYVGTDVVVGTNTLVTSSTNVGIGTATPAGRLDISSSGSTDTYISRSGLSASYGAAGIGQLIFRDAANTLNLASVQAVGYMPGSNGNLVFNVMSAGVLTERVRVTEAGNVGIGTSSPADRLDVRGSATAGIVVGRTSNAGAGSQPGALTFAAPNASGTARNWVGLRAVIGTATAGSEAASLIFSNQVAGTYTDVATLDGTGNLGLGVTPSAWASTFKALQVGSGGAIGDNGVGGYTSFSNNVAFAVDNISTGGRYIYTGAAAQYYQFAGAHIWRTAASGTAGTAITFTQAMTLDASGNLGLGTTSLSTASGYTTFTVSNASTGGRLAFAQGASVIGTLSNDANALYVQGESSKLLILGSGGSERWRINTSGHFIASVDNSYDIGASGATRPRNVYVGTSVLAPTIRSSTGSGIQISDSTISVNANYLICGTASYPTYVDGSSVILRSGSALPERMQIDGSGNITIGTGAVATTATDGFLYVPTCAGTPTGTPTTKTGRAPIVVDTTNNKLYFYSGGAWRDAGP